MTQTGLTVIPDDLVMSVIGKKVVFFVAAGCSVPSGLPSANTLAESVAAKAWAASVEGAALADFKIACFGTQDPTLDAVAEWFEQQDGNLDRFFDLLDIPSWRVRPNLAHAGMLRLAEEGLLSTILTTNWDELFEVQSHLTGCNLARARSAADLPQPGSADVLLLKIHGCLSDLSSIVVTKSALEELANTTGWADFKMQAAFQDQTVIFMGYSGSIPRIVTTMEEVAQWSPSTVHYVVDTSIWNSFSASAADFVAAARISEEAFFDVGAEGFVSMLVDRVLLYLVRQIAHEHGETEFNDLMSLQSGAGQTYSLPARFVEAIGSASSSTEFLRVLLRAIDREPVVRSRERQIGRVAAWVSYLTGRGWSQIDGYPLLQKDGEHVYLAAGRTGESTIKLMEHANMFLIQNQTFRANFWNHVDGHHITCVLIHGAGTLSDTSTGDLVTGDRGASISRGSSYTVSYRTEQEFLEEEAAA